LNSQTRGCNAARSATRRAADNCIPNFFGHDDRPIAGQDGRPSTSDLPSAFTFLGEGVYTHVCGYLTDASDCLAGKITSLSAESFVASPRPPLPRPPPPDPSPPMPSSPPTVNCRYGCEHFADSVDVQRFCTDGGYNSYPVAHDPATGAPVFGCQYGEQCDYLECGPRALLDEDGALCTDSCLGGPNGTVSNGVRWVGAARNGVCKLHRLEPIALII
jgi:hypothetical protein